MDEWMKGWVDGLINGMNMEERWKRKNLKQGYQR